MHPFIVSLLGQAGISGAAMREVRRTADNKARRPASESFERFGSAAQDLVRDQTGNEARKIKLNVNEPVKIRDLINQNLDGSLSDADMQAQVKEQLNLHKYASIQPQFEADSAGKARVADGRRGADILNINPNIGEETLAHELGHSVFGNTKVGDAMQRLRLNPKLNKAIAMGGGLAALTAAGFTPGDDDLGAAIAGTTLLSAPALIDEAMATKNAFDIMNRAGSRASLGQRGKLAGAYLTYLAAPASAAVLANTLGNQFDEDI